MASARCCRYGYLAGRLRGSVRRASGLVQTAFSETDENARSSEP